MVTSARHVEYLGVAHLIDDPRVLTVAVSIAAIESRHQTVLNLFQGATPIPQAYDIPLSLDEVLAFSSQTVTRVSKVRSFHA
jgi:hypothetical protein